MRRGRSIALGVAVVAGCASGPKWPDAPLAVSGHPLPPYQMHEECAVLAPGDRLEFAFEASEPVDFNVHYHDNQAVVLPVTRERTRAAAGVLPIVIGQDYCAMWEAGPAGALIDYRLRVRRAGS
jgi:hypothetical protein